MRQRRMEKSSRKEEVEELKTMPKQRGRSKA
jgi:hypothetical protein